ncbi:MAG: CvpA family protein [Alphaproteobacteria bacterium]|nr:CvpA family protein [Alphaproteobacteria bacterium]
MHQLNNLDVILIILTLLSMAISLGRGLVKEVLSIIGWVLAAAFIFYLLPYLAPFMKKFVASPMMASFVSALILLVLFYGLLFLATFKLLKKLRKSKMSGLDRGLGLIFGALRVFLLVILFHILLQSFLPEEAKKPFFADSGYYRLAGDFAEPIKNLMPKETIEKIKQKAEAQNLMGKETSEDLFKKLAEPRLEKTAGDVQKDEAQGYDKSETKSLDRLIENAAE